jgi:uncharacterized protein (DUF302 family)
MATPDDIRVVPTTATFDATRLRLREALTSRGLTVFAEIDHAANAQAAGLQMPPTVVLIFGNATSGTPLMLKEPNIALELPLRVLVREEPGRGTVLAYHDPVRLAGAFGVEDQAAGIAGLPALVAAVASA